MAPQLKPTPTDTVLLSQIERHLAELVSLSKKQLKALRELSEPPVRR